MWFNYKALYKYKPINLKGKNYLLFVFVFPTVLNTTLYTQDRVVKHCVF